jgi:hypothetical protein
MDDNTIYEGPNDYTAPAPDKQNDNPVVGHISTLFDSWSASRSQMEEHWLEYYRAWRCIQDANDKTRKHERSQIKIPATKEAVNNAADAVFDVLFSSRPYFRIQPQYVDLTGIEPQAAQFELDLRAKRSEKIGKYIAYLHQQEGFTGKVHQAVIEMCIYGTVVGRMLARPKTNRVTRRKQTEQVIMAPDGSILDTFPVEEFENIEQTVTRPELQHIPLENFYIDPSATTVDDGVGVIVRSWQRAHQLRQMKKLGVIDHTIDEAQTASRTASGGGEDELRERKATYFGLDIQTGVGSVELWEYWGWLDSELLEQVGFKDYDKDDGGCEVCVIIADRRWLLKLSKNPHYSGQRPFMKANFEKVPGEFYGIGIAEISSGPQKALNATVRSRLDNKALAINTMFGLNADKFLPGQNLSTYPGKAFLFRGDPKESLFPLVVPDVTSGTYQEAQEYERYVQSAHGISRMVGGMPAKRGEMTATEISMLMGQASTRLKVLVKTFEDDFMAPALRWYTRIILQHMDSSEMFALFNQNEQSVSYETITPEDISEDYEFIPQGIHTINAQQEAQRRITFLQLTANPVDMQIVNRAYLLKKVYETFDFDDNDAAIIAQPDPQMPQMLQQAQGVPGSPSAPQPDVGAGSGGEMVPQGNPTGEPEI